MKILYSNLEKEPDLLVNVIDLYKQNQPSSGLVHLYSTLLHSLEYIEHCNSFLKNVIEQTFNSDFKLNSDIIVHIINALYPIKSNLSNWDKSISYFKLLLIEEIGEEQTALILNKLLTI